MMKLIARLTWRAALLVLGVLAGLVGCDGGGYKKKLGGQWLHNDVAFTPEDPASFKPIDKHFARDTRRGYYRGSEIFDSDGASFEVLSDHEARDRHAVYWCDTYRKGQEYWSIQHLKVDRIRGADAATYTVLGSGYARDKLRVYNEGQGFEVRDPASFEPLANGYARDAQRAYYADEEIAGSDGASFAVFDGSAYAHDRHTAYHAYIERNTPSQGVHAVVRKLRDADLGSLRVPGHGYAVDAQRVWYRGERLAGADAASFIVIDGDLADADARDRQHAWRRGQRHVAVAASAASK